AITYFMASNRKSVLYRLLNPRQKSVNIKEHSSKTKAKSILQNADTPYTFPHKEVGMDAYHGAAENSNYSE
ncbi:Hypothetical predicted protein, partial [Mytilus galloprovincialis]